MWSDSVQSTRLDRALGKSGRVIIAGYVVTAGLGLVPGPRLLALTGTILPDVAAETFALAITFILSAMILLGRRVRTAALALAFLLLCSSYLATIGTGQSDQVGALWRDIAFAAVLLFVCMQRNEARHPPVLFSRSRIHGPAIVGREIPMPAFRRSVVPVPAADADDEITNIFAVPG